MISNMLSKKLGPKTIDCSGLQFDSKVGEGSNFWFIVETVAESLPASPQTTMNANTTIMRRVLTLPQHLRDPQEVHFTDDQNAHELLSLETDNSHSGFKLVREDKRILHLATIKKRLATDTNDIELGLNDREAILGQEEEDEDEAACKLKNINIQKNNNVKISIEDIECYLRPRLQSFSEINANWYLNAQKRNSAGTILYLCTI